MVEAAFQQASLQPRVIGELSRADNLAADQDGFGHRADGLLDRTWCARTPTGSWWCAAKT
ncbi:hypothetical protein [Streptomyces sp. DASNCL29]|uniref:hypothetical protein n=1 Tax=Streptomyces sp. DASNCL29 TaxID=2583819 RepID=UPI0014863ACC|nr:hypothetical protein [Streptomyces sp. DASNCL29]